MQRRLWSRRRGPGEPRRYLTVFSCSFSMSVWLPAGRWDWGPYLDLFKKGYLMGYSKGHISCFPNDWETRMVRWAAPLGTEVLGYWQNKHLKPYCFEIVFSWHPFPVASQLFCQYSNTSSLSGTRLLVSLFINFPGSDLCDLLNCTLLTRPKQIRRSFLNRSLWKNFRIELRPLENLNEMYRNMGP